MSVSPATHAPVAVFPGGINISTSLVKDAGLSSSSSPEREAGAMPPSIAGGSGSSTSSPPTLRSVGGDALDYKGIRLLPAVQQLEFDEGYYVGTTDERGAMAGYGKATWGSGDVYEGEWLGDAMHGRGVYTWVDGDSYRGDYVDGRMEGYGEMHDATGVYRGRWVDDMRQGTGRMEYAGGAVYEGEWLAGMRHGQGKLTEPSTGVTYEGEFVRNEKEGRGVQTNEDGDVYEGEFVDGKPNGRGTYLWSDGAKYIGMFRDGLKHGEGCEWLANGDWVAGIFVNGEYADGKATLHKATILTLEDEDDGGDGDDEEEEDGEVDTDENDGDDGTRTGSAKGGPSSWVGKRDGHRANAMSGVVTAAAMEPLDAEKLRRLADPNDSPSAMQRRGSNSSSGAKGRTGKRGSISGSGYGDNTVESSMSISSSTSPFSRAIAARPVILDDADLEGWAPLKTIGKGSFGAVYTALLRNGRTVCCKVIELGNVENEEEMEKLQNEIALMKRLHHPNIVQYYGSLDDKAKKTINIFMEYVSGGTLTSFVNKFSAIPLNTLRQWAYQMVCGVTYLHECGIVHRDIKGDNVLVSVDGIVKLADFGCSKAIDDVCSATHGCSTMVGTPYWMAPEVIKCEAGGYGMKSDVWSIGCTIVEMLTGKPPWPECNSMWAAVYKIANSTGLPTEIPSDVDPELMDLLERCFERDPRARPTAADLLNHPFLAKVCEGVLTAVETAESGI